MGGDFLENVHLEDQRYRKKGIGCENRRWMELAQDHVAILVSNGLGRAVTQC
jgi:hypothetical protein